ncbi:hypothetical protein TARUN_2656 [Trichoderma arundinaceum]|uniref:DUF6546 domain-containing protein n=1 Tax=Trichoderma arundinaceum TaxID=490622 RepID=A0A395NUN3_TRIAR|nr:hypothetical protein TARUN_2656 [Trichoderma arundinaceum]
MFHSAADDLLIKTAIQSLLLVLSAWDRNISLSLDINDDKDDASSNQRDSHVSRFNRAVPCEVDDARHRWDTTDWIVITAQVAVQNVFTRILGDASGKFEDEQMDHLEWWRELPPVPAITRLLLRQQTRRRWEPEALAEMLARFPRLRELHFEPWREWDNMLQETTDQGETAFSPSVLLNNNLHYNVYEPATEQGQASTITWRSTWEFLLQTSVIKAWQSLAPEPSQHGIGVIYESIGGDQIQCHGDAMLLVELPEVGHPTCFATTAPE